VAFSPSRIESFLQCPFQFFGRHTLGLAAAPPNPKERLDPLVQGNIVHEVVARGGAVTTSMRFSNGPSTRRLEKKLVVGHRTKPSGWSAGHLRRFLAAMPGPATAKCTPKCRLSSNCRTA
jgi:RecB family exonuclease